MRTVQSICLLIIAIVVSIFVWLVIDSYYSVFNSDAFAIPQKMMEYDAGRIGLTQLVMQKHVEHFHALIFLLSFLDWHFINGTQMLPRVAGTVAALMYAGLLVHLVVHDCRVSSDRRWVLAAALCAMVLSGTGWVIWTVSFQSLVSTFWILHVGGVYAACRSTDSVHHRNLWLLAAVLWSGCALFAHGSGFLSIIVPAVPLILRRRVRHAIFFVGGMSLLYAAGSLVSRRYPSGESPAIGDLSVLLFSNFDYLEAVCLYLGSSLIYDPRFALWAGAACVVWTVAVGAVVARSLYRGERLPIPDMLAICLVLSGGLSAGLAAGLRLSIAVQSGAPFNAFAFMESRYFLASSAVWIGLLILTAARVSNLGVYALAPGFGAAFFVSGLAIGVPAAKLNTAYMRIDEIAVRSRIYEAASMNRLFPDPVQAVIWLEYAAKEGKGPFSATSVIGSSSQVTPITDRRAVEIFLPGGGRGTACILSGPQPTPNEMVRLVDAQGRIVAVGQQSRYRTNVTAETLDVEDYLHRNGDVAAAVEAGLVDPWQHLSAALVRGEDRLARSRQPGWLAFTPSCDVSALR